jgi:GR25 family glycosyltransferase involved in LPS biosynthesis
MVAPNVSIKVIDFIDSSSAFSNQLRTVIKGKIEQVPAVLAEDDSRWRERTSVSAIGMGAAGCLLAHLDALSSLAEESKNSTYDPIGLILESDAILTSYGRSYLPQVLAHIWESQINFVQLGSNRSSLTNRQSTIRHRSLDRLETRLLTQIAPRFTQALTSVAHAYAIRASFAKDLLALGIGFQLPIDNWYRALALDPNRKMTRVRQDCFVTVGRPSQIDEHGR